MIISKKQYEDFYKEKNLEASMTYEAYLLTNLQKLQCSTEPSAEALIEEVQKALKKVKGLEDHFCVCGAPKFTDQPFCKECAETYRKNV